MSDFVAPSGLRLRIALEFACAEADVRMETLSTRLLDCEADFDSEQPHIEHCDLRDESTDSPADPTLNPSDSLRISSEFGEIFDGDFFIIIVVDVFLSFFFLSFLLLLLLLILFAAASTPGSAAVRTV